MDNEHAQAPEKAHAQTPDKNPAPDKQPQAEAEPKQKLRFTDLNKGQKNRVVVTFLIYAGTAALILAYFLGVLLTDRAHANESWDAYLQDPPQQAAAALEEGKNATRVQVGTYVENLRDVDLKNSTFRVQFLVWFRWQGSPGLDPANHFRIYKSSVNSQSVVAEVYQDGINYQLVSVDATVSKNYTTARFPLESHQLRFYVESTLPVQQVLYEADRADSGLNRNLAVTGYTLLRHGIGAVTYHYDSTHGDPRMTDGETNAELVTQMEINRADFGMYFKCFIALAGTLTWTLIALFICTYHRVDPLGMLPGALFGTVSNIMIGASLLPDALKLGLLEFVNIWGMLSILGATIATIMINRERKKSQGGEFAGYYGRWLFYTILVITVAGQVTLPLAAYIRVV